MYKALPAFDITTLKVNQEMQGHRLHGLSASMKSNGVYVEIVKTTFEVNVKDIDKKGQGETYSNL